MAVIAAKRSSREVTVLAIGIIIAYCIPTGDQNNQAAAGCAITALGLALGLTMANIIRDHDLIAVMMFGVATLVSLTFALSNIYLGGARGTWAGLLERGNISACLLLAMALPTTVFLVMKGASVSLQAIGFLAAIPLISSAISHGSIAALISGGVGAGFVVARISGARRLVSACGTVIVAVLLSFMVLSHRGSEPLRTGEIAWRARMVRISRAAGIMRENPLAGIGIGQSQRPYYVGAASGLPSSTYVDINPRSTWIGALAECGVWAGAVIGLWTVLLWKCLTYATVNIGGMLLSFVTYGCFESLLGSVQLPFCAILGGLCFGIIAAGQERSKEPSVDAQSTLAQPSEEEKGVNERLGTQS